MAQRSRAKSRRFWPVDSSFRSADSTLLGIVQYDEKASSLGGLTKSCSAGGAPSFVFEPPHPLSSLPVPLGHFVRIRRNTCGHLRSRGTQICASSPAAI